MSKNVNGGYRLIALGYVDLALAFSGVLVDGLYDAFDTDFGKKEIRLTQIKVSGADKNDVSVQVRKQGNDYIVDDVYGYDLTIKKTDGKLYAKTATLKVFADDIDSEDVDAGKALVADGEGGTEWGIPNLDGKYVKVMDAPSSTTLTDEQIALFEKGIFVNGTFLDVLNPVFYPITNGEGCVMYKSSHGGLVIGLYAINPTTKVIDLRPESNGYIEIDKINGVRLGVNVGSVSIKGINIPDVPNDASTKTYIPKLVNGTLTWVEEI